MTSIKLFVSYHDEHPLIPSDIVMPIQTGCSTSLHRYSNMLADNTGGNISDKNNRYCELTAQYWVWKNYDKIDNPDYVGFMHYRRHFILDDWIGNPKLCWLPKGHIYYVPYITDKYKEHFSDELIRQTMSNCDCVVLAPYDVKNIKSDSCRAQYCKLPQQKKENFDIFISTAKELYPQYSKEIDRIANGSVQYLCNMFIMRKELFFEYSHFCFSILDAVDNKIASSHMDTQASRFLGYFGEFLLSIYIFILKERQNIKIKEVNGSYILNDYPEKFLNLKYWKYKILSKITYGSKRRYYKNKKRKYKEILKYNKMTNK